MDSRAAPFNVVGAYPSMDLARKALDALQFAGVDPGHISLEGEGADRAADDASLENTSARDKSIIGHVVSRIAIFAAGGLVIGAAVGAILAALDAQVIPEYGTSTASHVAMWALLGVIVGALVGGYAGISQGEGWELTFQPRADMGEVLVAVHSDNLKDIQRADRIMRAKEATNVSQFNSDGHASPQPPHA